MHIILVDLAKDGKEGIQAADEILSMPGKVLDEIWDSIVINELVRIMEESRELISDSLTFLKGYGLEISGRRM